MRCEEINLVSNWENCYFMVIEGVMLEHKISNTRLEANPAKIDVVDKLQPSLDVKTLHNFLEHVGFYRRFIKDFS